ncbi:MAG: hypothetical protein P4L33_09620 [Capsulimonadaceae bacterium]|nr:hypothetical protein [Capsulimonadaceae bacterium]
MSDLSESAPTAPAAHSSVAATKAAVIAVLDGRVALWVLRWVKTFSGVHLP